MLNDVSFRFYYKMQGIKSAKMIAKLEQALSTALQNKTKEACSYRIYRIWKSMKALIKNQSYIPAAYVSMGN